MTRLQRELRAVLAAHGPFIRRTLGQLGVAARDVPDVAQEVVRGMARGLPTFDPALAKSPETALRGWIFGICARQAANYHRSEARRQGVETDEGIAVVDSAPTAEEQLEQRERRAFLWTLLDDLHPDRRAVVVAHDLEGEPMTSFARRVSIPVNTAWNRLRLARLDLAAAVRRHLARVG